MVRTYFILFISVFCMRAHASHHQDIGPEITSFFEKISPYEIISPERKIQEINLIDGAYCFIETRTKEGILDQRIHFDKDDINHNGMLLFHNTYRGLRIKFSNAENGKLSLKMSTGTSGGGVESINMTVKNLRGIKALIYRGNHGNMMRGFRESYFGCYE